MRPDLEMDQILPHHDNARTSHEDQNTEEIHLIHVDSLDMWIVDNYAFSLDLAPSEYHRFSQMKQALTGNHYEIDEKVDRAVKTCLSAQPAEFDRAAVHALVQRWKAAIERGGGYTEKYVCDPKTCSFILMCEPFW